MKFSQWMTSSKLGPLHLVASESGLRGIYWKSQNIQTLESLDPQENAAKILAQTVKQLNEYFEGKRKSFDLPLEPEGTDFQKQVWQQLLQIPYGQTVSYKEIAMKIQNRNAVRAVGAANGRNPLAIVVPCHRVIASDGTLAGYAGGTANKSLLLDLERGLGNFES